jgi:serine protease Do
MVKTISGVTRTYGAHVVSLACVLVLFVLPLSGAFGEEESIAALRQMGKAFASIAEKSSPAVVGIQATKVVSRDSSSRARPFGGPSNPFEEELFKYFYGPRRSPREWEQPESRQTAQGSGFIISADGYILTNNHMVGESESVTVNLADGRKVPAEIVGTDPHTDVAVVKIDETGLPYIKLANSDALEVGEWVVAIGSPFGLSHTVTAGIVSAKGRSRIGVADYEDFIQTDAAINFGNSGGPLLNLDGEAVGINTAIIGPGGNVGIGLAIPSNMARDIYGQLKETGEVVRGFLGVQMDDVKPGMGEYFGLEDDKGVIVMDVVEDSPAEKAGFEKDDIVVELEGDPVTGMFDFRNRVAMHKPGSKVRIGVMRDGKRKTLTAVLDKRPESVLASGRGSSAIEETLGMTLEPLTEELAARLGYEDLSGVVATAVKPGSPADEAGIQAGTLIMEVNRKPVRSVKGFTEAIEEAREEQKKEAMLRIRDDEWTRLVMLRLSDK